MVVAREVGAINNRTSVRHHSERFVPREAIMKLIENAIRASTASGLENWKFVVFESEDVRRKLHECMVGVSKN